MLSISAMELQKTKSEGDAFNGALDSGDLETMLTQAEQLFDSDYLQAWALAEAATAFAREGEAAYFLARRFIPEISNSIKRQEVLDGKQTGEYLLNRACSQNNPAAKEFFKELNGQEFQHSTTHDKSRAEFEEYIRSRKQLRAEDFLRNAQGCSEPGHSGDFRHHLRGLTLAMIGFFQYPDDHNLPFWIAQFASNRQANKSYKDSGDFQHLFSPNIPLAEKYLAFASKGEASTQARILLLQAHLNRDKKTDNPRELYSEALAAPDFHTLPDHVNLKRSIEREIHTCGASCGCAVL